MVSVLRSVLLAVWNPCCVYDGVGSLIFFSRHRVAIHIINLPTNLETQVTHRYSANSFKLHRLPTPRPGQVLGLVGTNGIGKSTALKILSGKQKPNLGRYENPPDWNETLAYFRGSELQNYLTKVVEDNIKAVVKPQYVDKLPQAIRGKVRSVKALLESQCQRNNLEEMVDILGRKIYNGSRVDWETNGCRSSSGSGS